MEKKSDMQNGEKWEKKNGEKNLGKKLRKKYGKNLEKKSQKKFQLNCRKKIKNGTYKKIRPLNVQKAPYLEGLLFSSNNSMTHSQLFGVSTHPLRLTGSCL